MRTPSREKRTRQTPQILFGGKPPKIPRGQAAWGGRALKARRICGSRRITLKDFHINASL
jgi:hypothetical protein